MKELLKNFWFRLLLAPIFSLTVLGLWGLKDNGVLLFLDTILFLAGGLLIWVAALYDIIEWFRKRPNK
jgi:hypothetical protein